ncbi:MAG: hypothetical protein EBU08_06885 [Micrococcales bacterium]|nr:hypothetical protein [Micrococcales bacterium]
MAFMKSYAGGRRLRAGRKLMGRGMGSVLLNVGGAGGGSSYASIQDYEHTTGRQVPMGRGLGMGLNSKLEQLMVKPLAKKPTTIRF